MQPSQRQFHVPIPHLAWLLGLMLLACQPGCGPASSDNALNLEPRTSRGGQPVSEQGPPPHNDQIGPAASAAPAGHGEARPAVQLVVPDWMSAALASPDVHVRRRALDHWGQQAPTGLVDPLIVALEDDDEQVRAKALKLIEQDWLRTQAAKER